MTTAEVTPTSIALAATIGGHKATFASLCLEKIHTGEPIVQDVFLGTSSAAANFIRALKGADTGCVTTTVAEIIAGALAGVTLSANGAAFTAPDLLHVAHFSTFIEQIDFSVNSLIARIFEAAKIHTEDVTVSPNSLGAAEMTEILSSVMAEIYFAHIVTIRGVSSSLLASLRLVQCIKMVTSPAESFVE